MNTQVVLNPNSSLRPILIVEDNDMDLDFCLQAFEEHAIDNPVIVCRDGDEAIDYINRHASPSDRQFPLLVLLDLHLPKIDGIEVVRHARRDANWRMVPFIMLTTSSDNADITAAYLHGVNAYIVKPVDFANFSEVVKHLKVFWILTNEPPFAAPVGT